MSTNLSMESITATLQQAMTQLKSFGVDGSSTGTGSSGSDSEYINSLFSLIQNGEAAVEGNDEQRAQAITKIVGGLVEMVSSACNHTTKANQEVDSNAKAIDNNSKAADKKANEVESKIKELRNNIAVNATNISNAIEEIKELGEENSDIAELKDLSLIHI